MPDLKTEINESSLPVLNYKRSGKKYRKNYKTTLNTGMFVPIYANELVQPGDTFKIDLSFLARMITPFQPVMDNAYIQFFAFACDWLDLWNDTKPFWGENVLGAWAQETEYFTPKVKIPANTKVTAHSVLAYLGIPQNTWTSDLTISCGLSVNMYNLVYNEWIRNQNYIAPLSIDMSGTTITFDPTDSTKGGLCKNVMKFHDRFTAGVPAPERGEEVGIPLGTTAPVAGTGKVLGLTDGTSYWGATSGTGYAAFLLGGTTDNYGSYVGNSRTEGGNFGASGRAIGVTSNASNSGLYADLADAVSATLAAQRLAVATNHILEKLAIYGGRYREIIRACWGVSSSDLSQHIPEYLGGWRQPVNMEQVTATASVDSGLGETGAMSVTNGYGHLLTKSFNQHAVIMVFAAIRTDQTYGQGIPRQYWKERKYDYYWNDYAGISFQPVYYGEIFTQATSMDKEAMSFLPPWQEYKSEVNQLTGMFNPYYSTNDGTTKNWLKEWTYANNFANVPVMAQTFLEETPENMDRTLTTQSSLGDQFLLDCEFIITKYSEVPNFRIPGLDRF